MAMPWARGIMVGGGMGYCVYYMCVCLCMNECVYMRMTVCVCVGMNLRQS